MGLEILDAAIFDVDVLIVPVGGGGLSSGLVEVFRELSPKTEIKFVEPVGAPSLKTSLEAGKHVVLENINTFVDGAAVAAHRRAQF